MLRKNCTSGYTGVTFDKKSLTWKAQKVCNGINRYIGSYKTKEEAHEARVRFENNLKNESRHIIILDGPPTTL